MVRRTATKARDKGGPQDPAKAATRGLGRRAEAGFRTAVADAVRQAREAGVPVAILNEANELEWLHPDGVIRPTAEPVHLPAPRSTPRRRGNRELRVHGRD